MTRFIVITIILQQLNLLACAQIEEDFDRDYLTLLALPYVRTTESIAEYFEDDQLCRIVIGKVNSAFVERGYRVKDYMSIIKLDHVVPDATDLEREKIKQAIKNSDADVVIYVEINVIKYSEKEQQLQLFLSAIDQYSAESYAHSVVVESNRRFYTKETIGKAAADNRLNSTLNEFVDKLDQKFFELLKNGRTVSVRLSLQEGSNVSFGTQVDDTGEDLATSVERWIQKNVSRVYSTDADLDYWQTECNIPLVTPEKEQITPASFRSDLKKYLESLAVNDQPLEVVGLAMINTVIQIELK